MTGWMKALTAAFGPGLGTVNKPELIEVAMSRCVPIAVLMTALDDVVGRPRVGFSKCVYLNVRKLIALMTHDAVRRADLLPRLVAGARRAAP